MFATPQEVISFTALNSPSDTLAEAISILSIFNSFSKSFASVSFSETEKEKDIEKLSNLLREHAINPETKVYRGTLGKNREIKRDKRRVVQPKLPRLPSIEGYILYNQNTKVASFYDLKNRNVRTFMEVKNENDENDILYQHNLN